MIFLRFFPLIIIAFFLIIKSKPQVITLRDQPKIIAIISKISAILCLVIVLTMVADLMLTKNILKTQVNKVENSRTVHFGIYEEELNKTAYSTLKNNENVEIQVSKVYDEIKKITILDGINEVLYFPTADNYAFLFMMVIFSLPSLIFIKNISTTLINKFVFFYLNIISLVMGFVGLLLIIKLLLVHVLHLVERM